MSLTINTIYIENFRSIRKLEIRPNLLSILVGKNDSGKSNVLRALNLFFNNETNPGLKLIFSEDHNFYDNPNRRAQEIKVRIEFKVPSSYRKTNGEIVCWEKIWRESGCVSNEYWGYRKRKNRLGNIVKDRIEIPSKSNLHSLLTKIEFRYIPAIKDKHYFESLRCQIYKTVSEVAKKTFRESSKNFEDSIGSHLEELTKDILDSLGIDTRMALPRDLSHVFERLDFLGGEMQVSLDNRGDGIKVQHIPLILKFLADKKLTLSSRGAPPYTFIWGYEEPENNLEITSAIRLAERFWEYMYEDVAQIFVTTHSPVFYNLVKKNTKEEEYVSCGYVHKDDESKGTRVGEEIDALDEQMGAMALYSEKIEALENELLQRAEAKAIAKDLAKSKKRRIFVEGLSDKIIFERALEVFFPEYKEQVAFETKDNGAGHSYVIDMLTAWYSVKKHDNSKPKSVGIVDRDADAIRSATDWNKHAKHINSCKCFILPKPGCAIQALSKGYKADVTLETLYPKEVWDWHVENGLLEANEIKEILPGEIVNGLLSGSVEIGDLFKDVEEVFLKYKFPYEKKIPVAKRVAKYDDEKFKEKLVLLEGFMRQIITYLFADED